MSNEYKPFSERLGLTQPNPIQREDISIDLRNDLWSALYNYFPDFHNTYEPRQHHGIYLQIWTKFLHKPVDEYSKYHTTRKFVKGVFLSGKWYAVLELIEFCLQNIDQGHQASREHAIRNDNRIRQGQEPVGSFEQQCNRVLEKGNSAYRIIGELVSEIISEEEIQSIEKTMTVPFEGVREHIRQSLALLSARENPDYPNSIKESISAVEALAKEVTGKKNATLGELIDQLPIQHKAFRIAIEKLYGFTCNAGGIRHGATGVEPLDINQNTARFMLITCSAFVNYIVGANNGPTSGESGKRKN